MTEYLHKRALLDIGFLEFFLQFRLVWLAKSMAVRYYDYVFAFECFSYFGACFASGRGYDDCGDVFFVNVFLNDS